MGRGADEEMIMDGLSKTAVKGKQSDTNLGGAMKNGEYINDAQSQDRRSLIYPGYVDG